MAIARWRKDYTDNATLLAASVHKLHDGGGTALYDAVYKACTDKFLKDRSEHPLRKAIVIVSDGERQPERDHESAGHRNGTAF